MQLNTIKIPIKWVWIQFAYTLSLAATLALCPLIVTADAYLDALDEEISKPVYLDKAEKELRKKEQTEKAQTTVSPKTKRAMQSISNFEQVFNQEYPATYQIYLKLDTKTRLTVFEKLKETRRLTDATKMVLQRFLE
jgi:hypothetical protein